MFAAWRTDFTPAQRAHTKRVLWLLLAYAVVLPPLVWVRANTAVAGYIPMLMAVATNATMGAAVVWGFLQAFGVMPLVEAYWIPLVWVVIQGFQACFGGSSARSQDD